MGNRQPRDAGLISELPIHIKQYETMTDFEHRSFQEQLEVGGEVDIRGLWDRMRRAYLLAYVADGVRFIAIGAVKRPAESYVRSVSRRSGYQLKGYAAELGWVYVTPEARGRHLASRISEALCSSYGSSVFATTRTDNAPMHLILDALGFERAGSEYDSVEHPGKKIQLWVLPR